MIRLLSRPGNTLLGKQIRLVCFNSHTLTFVMICLLSSSSSADADDVITPEDVFDIMKEDVQQADLILWVGISFEQSASTAYFRRVSFFFEQ